MNLNNFLSLDNATARADDVFSMEFRNKWEARDARRAALLATGVPERPSFARRTLARGLAAVTRGSATAVRQLDGVVADDLGRSLSAAK